MADAAAAKISAAVLANSRELVDFYLDGTSPSAPLGNVIPTSEEVMETVYGRLVIPDHIKVTKATGSRRGAPTLLHLAVINCYHMGASSSYSDKGKRKDALAIIRSLLRSGADPSALAPNMVVCNITGFSETGTQISTGTSGTGTDSLDLASFLKKHGDKIRGSEQASMMDSVIHELVSASSAASSHSILTVPVPKSALTLWEKLCLSEDFSDVKFICEDGTIFPSHRSILAAASPYFATVFKGPWKENHRNGEWVTSIPPHIMKAVLVFIYTGKIDPSFVDSDPCGILSVASEYGLDELTKLGEASCVRSLSRSNVKDLLQLAHLHSSVSLKKACFSFVKKNAAHVLTDPTMMQLATEDAELWGQLTKALTGENDSKRAKRRRTS